MEGLGFFDHMILMLLLIITVVKFEGVCVCVWVRVWLLVVAFRLLRIYNRSVVSYKVFTVCFVLLHDLSPAQSALNPQACMPKPAGF